MRIPRDCFHDRSSAQARRTIDCLCTAPNALAAGQFGREVDRFDDLFHEVGIKELREIARGWP